MRNDFQKLLCECYKEGRGYATSSGSVRGRLKQCHTDDEGYMPNVNQRRLLNHRKSFGENLAPLKRYINKQVGRSWDKVYSDICKYNSKAGAVGLHIFQHLYHYIYTDVTKDDEKRIFSKAGSDSGYDDRELSFGSIYVDPDDHIIKRYKKNKRKKQNPNKPKQSIRIDRLHTIECENGTWYAFTWKDTPREGHSRMSRRGTTVIYYDSIYCRRRLRHVSYPEAKVYATHKHQLGQRDLKKHKLSNS